MSTQPYNIPLKATVTPAEQIFKPVAVTLTFESAEELAQVYAIFNHETVRKGVGMTHEQTKAVRVAIDEASEDAVNFQPYWDKLQNTVKGMR